MNNDILTPSLIKSMVRTLSVSELIRTAEVLKQSGQLNSLETIYETWIDVHPDEPLLCAVLFNYSVVLADAGKLEMARGCLERAIAKNPEFMPAYINLGRVYERLGRLPLAVFQWSAALAKMAAINGSSVLHKTTTLNQCARALEAANQDETAEDMLRQSLELDRGQREVVQHYVAIRQRQCSWPVVVSTERISRSILMRGSSPLSAASLSDDPLQQLALAAYYNQSDVGTPDGVRDSWPEAIQGGGRLRIGYLSSDLREHAVGYLMKDVLGLHDRQKVEIFAYYCGPTTNDSLHQHFKADAEHWRSIENLDDETVARQMAEDGIQILIDLNGYTREARLKLVAMRPAPILVNWLGFPGTMGSPYHQYIIADDFIIPKEHELYYSERVLRLPCYQPSGRNREVSAKKPTRKEVGLPEDAMVYCCFNGAHKITRFTYERWLTILERVPGSVLWLLSSTENTNAKLSSYAESKGIAKERIIFAEKLANPYHLARYSLADLFLDTTPYGAHTTSSDALWAGVPVLTFSGRSFASRVCGSLVRAAGVDELICYSAEQFVERAIALGNERSQLAKIRRKLEEGHDSCTLFDMPKLVSCLEGLYERMWQEYRGGALPRPDLRNLDAYLEVGCDVDPDTCEVQTLPDYHGWWIERLARRHRFRPIIGDRRVVALAPEAFGFGTATKGEAEG